ncbi:uncharacterized protein LACBIDRAFT_331106 [Laccaria bicolor S238N-H82]|uniref:Predicted protein n=1 Tax=Laccaria bicolor (strain S238N-H82 / ATCC MYA-4686) TaxID=486041 RepID=B0DNH5_LACBS|nr:uncharacterized protein LACBIDRAFT_331106 [Laccaria bicolor S238N-H82]EDR03870.1 predicted protein [Laccaria bicolor S238N-H82]|eukprot:XP_001885438.1 predicted protein [Laccaria bicolor S238N-H82]
MWATATGKRPDHGSVQFSPILDLRTLPLSMETCTCSHVSEFSKFSHNWSQFVVRVTIWIAVIRFIGIVVFLVVCITARQALRFNLTEWPLVPTSPNVSPQAHHDFFPFPLAKRPHFIVRPFLAQSQSFDHHIRASPSTILWIGPKLSSICNRSVPTYQEDRIGAARGIESIEGNRYPDVGGCCGFRFLSEQAPKCAYSLYCTAAAAGTPTAISVAAVTVADPFAGARAFLPFLVEVAGLAWGAGAWGEGEPGECFLEAAAVVVVDQRHCVINLSNALWYGVPAFAWINLHTN